MNTIMDEAALHQCLSRLRLGPGENAPIAEQIRLLEQWHLLYWQVTLRAVFTQKQLAPRITTGQKFDGQIDIKSKGGNSNPLI